MGNTRDILLDDGSIVEDFRYVVACSADQLHAPFERLMIGLAPNECRQKRMMNIDDSLWISIHKLRRKNLHVARQDDEVHRLPLQQSQNLPFRRLLFSLLNRNQIKGNPIELRNRLTVRMVGDNARNIARQLSTLMAIK